MKKPLIYILFGVSLLVAGCKDGDPGPTGQKGATGTDGNKGATGDTGLGFDASVKDGNILITMSGKRPGDNIDFKATQDFKYTLDAQSPADVSTVSTDANTGTLTFYVRRFVGAVDEHHNNNYFDIEFSVTSGGVISVDYFDLATSVIVDGTKYFGISQYDDSNEITTLTNYSYNATTGALKFNFSGTFPTNSSSTGNDLLVTGVANVNVYEPLNSIVDGD